MSDSQSLFRFVSAEEAAALAGVSPITLVRHASGAKALRARVQKSGGPGGRGWRRKESVD